MNNDPIFDGSLLEFINSFDPMQIDITFQDQKIPYIMSAKVLIDMSADITNVDNLPALRDTHLFVQDADLNKVKKIFAMYCERIARTAALSELVTAIQQATKFYSVLNVSSMYDDELYCMRKDLASEIDESQSVDEINNLMFTSTLMLECELKYVEETIKDSNWIRMPFYSDLISLFQKVHADVKDVKNNNWLVELLEPFRVCNFGSTSTLVNASRFVQ